MYEISVDLKAQCDKVILLEARHKAVQEEYQRELSELVGRVREATNLGSGFRASLVTHDLLWTIRGIMPGGYEIVESTPPTERAGKGATNGSK